MAQTPVQQAQLVTEKLRPLGLRYTIEQRDSGRRWNPVDQSQTDPAGADGEPRQRVRLLRPGAGRRGPARGVRGTGGEGGPAAGVPALRDAGLQRGASRGPADDVWLAALRAPSAKLSFPPEGQCRPAGPVPQLGSDLSDS